MIHIAAIGLIAFSVSFIATGRLIAILTKKGVIDIPNQRSSHRIPTPRGGGIAVVVAIFAGIAAAFLTGHGLLDGYFCLGLGILALTGYLDDKINLSPLIRFLVQAIAAALVIYPHGWIERLPLPDPLNWELGILAYPVTFLWFLGVMNIYNFLDGIDGYAGVQAVVAGLGIGLAYPRPEVWLVSVVIIGAALGFLKYNWMPAKIFMGDVGSISLGFLFASLPFYLEPGNPADGVFVMAILLWFFLADGTYTLLRRALGRERIWEAHRTHLYQRLNISGWSHAGIVSAVLPFQLILVAVTPLKNWVPLVAAMIFSGIMIAITPYMEKRVPRTPRGS